MDKNSVQKCRTCLRSSPNTFSLKNLVTDCHPKKTYGQLLEEYAKLECTTDYEHLMPQNICPLCCRELRNSCAFIKQAQNCNTKLLHVISKKMDCLREKIINVPENQYEVIKTSSDINTKRIVSNFRTNEQTHRTIETNLAENENSIKQSKKSEANNDISNIGKAIHSNERSESVDLLLESATIAENDNGCKASLAVTSCPICEKKLGAHDDLKIHMRTVHDIVRKNNFEVKKQLDCKPRLEARKTFDCRLCPSKYSNRYSYIYHLIRKHNIDERKTKTKEKLKTKLIKCRSCDYTARTYAALHYHTRAKHGTENDKFKCKFCDYLCIKKFDLLTHVRNVHKELIKTLKTEAEANGEVREEFSESKNEREDVQDNNSLEEFSSDDNIRLVRATNNTKTNMKEDDEQFSDEEFIRNILNIKKRHNKTSTTSLARKCNECGNIYRNYRALYAHQKHVHISEDKYSLCPHCGKKYKRKCDLRIHIEKNHIPKSSIEITKQPSKIREKRFMCTECSYVCTTITILNIHIKRKHTGEKPYKCDICSKSFLIPYDLKIHRYLHTGERPYKCPVCLKGFRDNSHMLKHKRLHSSERPFKCKECGKCFALSYYLSVHNRTHLKEKKLNCITCGKVFENRSLLNLHRINEDHQDEIA